MLPPCQHQHSTHVLRSEDVTYNVVNGAEGLLELLEPHVQRLFATAATASAPASAPCEEEAGMEVAGMVTATVLVLLCGSPEQVAGLEETGASDTLEGALQVCVCVCVCPCAPPSRAHLYVT